MAMNEKLEKNVLFEEMTTDNGKKIGIATLNSEKTLNALSLEMVDLLYEQLMLWKKDSSVPMIVIQGAGDRAFCAGGDLQSLYKGMQEQKAAGTSADITANKAASAFFEREYRLDYLIHTYPKPILTWGHGIIMGGGMGLVAGASHRVVTETARLAMPEITIGLYPDVGGTWFLRYTPGFTGDFLALTGANFGAQDAVFVKLADYRLEHEQKESLLATLTSQPWDGENDHLRLSQILIEAETAVKTSFEMLPTPLQDHYAQINQLCRTSSLMETVSNIVNLKTEDKWLQRAIDTLKAGSPTSAGIIYDLKKRGARMSLAEILRMEYVVSLHCCADGEFMEGIRALIVDKDRKPQWNPSAFAELTQDRIDTFFSHTWTEKNHPLADLA